MALAEFELRVLVSVLGAGRSAYAVAVHGELQRRTRRKASLGAVYVTLDRLEHKGLLVSAFDQPRAERGGRARRHFALSRKGRAAVRQECQLMRNLLEGLDIQSETA